MVMDEIQKKLCNISNTYPDFLDSLQGLKSILLYLIPTNKLEINLLLNAYDEGIHTKLSERHDPALFAIQSIGFLEEVYGLTDDIAFWTIVTWCYMLGLDDIANALDYIKPKDIPQNSSQQNNVFIKGKQLGMGTYMAGIDFPPGIIKISVAYLDKDFQKIGIYYELLKKRSNSIIIANGYIKTQAVLAIRNGERLGIGCGGELDLTIVNGA